MPSRKKSTKFPTSSKNKVESEKEEKNKVESEKEEKNKVESEKEEVSNKEASAGGALNAIKKFQALKRKNPQQFPKFSFNDSDSD